MIVGYLMSKHFYFKQFSLVYEKILVYLQLNLNTVLFQTMQFSIIMYLKWKKRIYFKHFSLT